MFMRTSLNVTFYVHYLSWVQPIYLYCLWLNEQHRYLFIGEAANKIKKSLHSKHYQEGRKNKKGDKFGNKQFRICPRKYGTNGQLSLTLRIREARSMDNKITAFRDVRPCKRPEGVTSLKAEISAIFSRNSKTLGITVIHVTACNTRYAYCYENKNLVPFQS
jgi:hypothetical protein